MGELDVKFKKKRKGCETFIVEVSLRSDENMKVTWSSNEEGVERNF